MTGGSFDMDTVIRNLLMMKFDMARVIIREIELDIEGNLPFYSPQFRNNMLDTAHKRLKDASDEAVDLRVELPITRPISPYLLHLVDGVTARMLNSRARWTMADRLNALVQLSIYIDFGDFTRLGEVHNMQPDILQKVRDEIRFRTIGRGLIDPVRWFPGDRY